ncbi:MAG: RecQ family ATP-dependent DNA helicase [Chryseolinea sp.]
METPLSILKKYWKHDQFRALQEEIVHASLTGKDVLALLPTGGGKSVCFQVPALLRDGLCIVVTPLIALMKDQVEQLKSKGIEAVAIHAAMPRAQVDLLLDNCIYGNIKFLYVSPERLQNELFIERVKKMNVGLLAIDEAHCISQWGYDFRPAYLNIASIRMLHPNVPVIALTASATAQVRKDIAIKLEFKKDSVTFQKSFARDNLSFVVRRTENKERKVLEILQKVPGSSIIYVRSRKATQEIAAWLVKKKITASFYHAGLSFEERANRQDSWIQNRSRVMVSTNAFGMGIDKPDVRVVIHLDLPENLESYYQEAGRGGRDGKRAFAVMIYHDADVSNLEQKTAQSQPEPAFLRKVYQALCNYYQLAMGSSAGESYDFDLHEFCERFHYHPTEVYAALKKLEEEGIIQFNDSFYSPSSIHISLDKARLYQFQVANVRFDPLIKTLMRMYGGEMLSGFSKISEPQLSRVLKITVDEVTKMLKHLNDLRVAIYQPVKDTPQITFVIPRQDADRLPLDLQRLLERRKLILSKMKAMADFVTSAQRCRMQRIQDYFDEVSSKSCGICDVCIAQRKKENSAAFENLRHEVLRVLNDKPLTVEQVQEYISPIDQELFVDVVRDMVDEGVLQYDTLWKLGIAKQKP